MTDGAAPTVVLTPGELFDLKDDFCRQPETAAEYRALLREAEEAGTSD